MDEKLQEELARLLNQYSVDANLGIPDFILAAYIKDSLIALKKANDRTTSFNKRNE